MKAIEQARKLYLEYCYRKTFLRDDEKSQLKSNIHQCIAAAFTEAPLKNWIQNSWMFDILKSTLRNKANDSHDLMLIERAFRYLEKYFLQIVQQPWKLEFREIKMYGGFYRTKIKAVIHDCEHIFERAGYMVLPDKCTMVYRGQMDQTFLPILAFDCRLIQTQCKAIAQDFDNMRGFSVSLRDVISVILSDEYSEDMLAFRSSQKYVRSENTIADSSVAAPPLVPRREPIFRAPVLRQILKTDQDLYLSNDDKRLLEPRLNARNALTPRTSYLPSDPTLFFPKPQLISDPISEHLSYMESDNVEIIPELPEGTCEDHMRESLRLVKQQTNRRTQFPDEWNWVGRNNTPAIYVPHLSTTNPYSGDMIQHYKPEYSRDEGIGMSTSKSFSPSSKFSFFGNQPILPNKPPNLPQTSFDPGNPESISSQPSASSLMHNVNQPIYLPPNIVTGGTNPNLHRKVSLSRQNAVPPQIPPRALKPTQNTEKDPLYAQQYLPALASRTSQYPAALQTQISNEARIAHLTRSAPEYFLLHRAPEMEHVLHRERPAVLKSNSLKVTGNNSPLSEQIATSRLARSMDMTFWECPSCYKLNSSPNVVCSTCSQTYTGTDVTLSDYNKTEATF